MEIWKDIKGFEGLYQISDLGRVKSLERKVKGRFVLMLLREKILSPICILFQIQRTNELSIIRRV